MLLLCEDKTLNSVNAVLPLLVLFSALPVSLSAVGATRPLLCGVWERFRTFFPLYPSSSSSNNPTGLSLWGRSFCNWRLSNPVSLECTWTSRLQLLRAKNPRPSFDPEDFPSKPGYSSHSDDLNCGKQLSGFTTLEKPYLGWMSKGQGVLLSLFCLFLQSVLYAVIVYLLSWVYSLYNKSCIGSGIEWNCPDLGLSPFPYPTQRMVWLDWRLFQNLFPLCLFSRV